MNKATLLIPTSKGGISYSKVTIPMKVVAVNLLYRFMSPIFLSFIRLERWCLRYAQVQWELNNRGSVLQYIYRRHDEVKKYYDEHPEWKRD